MNYYIVKKKLQNKTMDAISKIELWLKLKIGLASY